MWSDRNTTSLLLLPPAPPLSLTQDTVLHKLLQHESFPQTAVQELLQHVSSTGSASCQKTCSSVSSPPQGRSSCQEPAPTWALQGLQPPFGTSTCCGVGSSMGCSMSICSSSPQWVAGGQSTSPSCSPRTAGESLHQHPSFFTDFGPCRVVSHFFFTSLSHSCYTAFVTLSYMSSQWYLQLH